MEQRIKKKFNQLVSEEGTPLLNLAQTHDGCKSKIFLPYFQEKFIFEGAALQRVLTLKHSFPTVNCV